ncbi:hypothetical protein I5G63_gp065 [Mycobacterium phage Imvubu]|uniref:Uncharacterized protein n=1 Tax=Mycobacterium phage Imvubu TaxID=2686233 RepID=A0A6B9L7Q1_9CAUD|nr:hypothetical protein I5G63_gp065 [Mycobacterium phage Imvubu]QHB37806.1 hypothetical protein PBI_IMVUBU_65 [Mycobacterium phage Imvubu]
MNITEAMTRPDRWQPMQTDSGNWRVGRIVDASGSIEWHRGMPRFGHRYNRGGIITLRRHDHAMARAGALNRADAEASR